MRILFLISTLGAGGAERVAVTLCNAWAARGDGVTLVQTFSGSATTFYELSTAVEMVCLSDIVPATRKSLSSYARRLYALRRLISSTAPDVIISFLPNVNVAAILCSAFLRIPLIICERTDPSICPYARKWHFPCNLFYRFADMLTVQTEAVASKVQYVYSGLKKVRTVPNPLPMNMCEIESRRRGQRKVVLSLGRLSSEKQIDRLLSAFIEVARHQDEWDLHIYGDGPRKAALEKQIEDSGIGHRILLKGTTRRPWQVMSLADTFVMTSSYEGFPNALLEAMGMGLPCVVFDCPSGPRELTRDGRDALLVPLNDHDGLAAALTRIMNDAALRNVLSRNARDSVHERFSLHCVIEAWDSLFREVGALR